MVTEPEKPMSSSTADDGMEPPDWPDHVLTARQQPPAALSASDRDYPRLLVRSGT